MRFVVTFLLNLTVFGAGIPNILVCESIKNPICNMWNDKNEIFSFVAASQNMQLIGYRISDGNFYFSFCYWLIILGIVLSPIMWLGSPKNMKSVNIRILFVRAIVSTVHFAILDSYAAFRW